MFAELANSPRLTHPGIVTFVGTDGVERTESADRLPGWVAFAPNDDGDAVPVVRVVRLKTDRGTALRSYGADGRLLWVGLTVTGTPTDGPVATQRPAPSLTVSTGRSPVGWF